MSSLEFPTRSLSVVIIEASVCLSMNVISVTGNLLVCLAVYKNPAKLRSTIDLYIISLAVSDLLCATVEMPLSSAVLITGKWDFGDASCQTPYAHFNIGQARNACLRFELELQTFLNLNEISVSNIIRIINI